MREFQEGGGFSIVSLLKNHQVFVTGPWFKLQYMFNVQVIFKFKQQDILTNISDLKFPDRFPQWFEGSSHRINAQNSLCEETASETVNRCCLLTRNISTSLLFFGQGKTGPQLIRTSHKKVPKSSDAPNKKLTTKEANTPSYHIPKKLKGKDT